MPRTSEAITVPIALNIPLRSRDRRRRLPLLFSKRMKAPRGNQTTHSTRGPLNRRRRAKGDLSRLHRARWPEHKYILALPKRLFTVRPSLL